MHRCPPASFRSCFSVATASVGTTATRDTSTTASNDAADPFRWHPAGACCARLVKGSRSRERCLWVAAGRWSDGRVMCSSIRWRHRARQASDELHSRSLHCQHPVRTPTCTSCRSGTWTSGGTGSAGRPARSCTCLTRTRCRPSWARSTLRSPFSSACTSTDHNTRLWRSPCWWLRDCFGV